MGQANKDWSTLEQGALDNGSVLGPVATAARQVYQETLDTVDGAESMNKGAMTLLHERRLGVSVSSKPLDDVSETK